MTSASGETADIPRTRLSQQELTVLASRHRAFLKRQPGGTRASFKMRDLSHLDLSGFDLTEADFSGAKLFSTRLLGSNLSNADLYGTDMRLANLTGATMTRTDLRGACLRGASSATPCCLRPTCGTAPWSMSARRGTCLRSTAPPSS